MPDENELLAQAQAAREEVPRSKLEKHCAVIFELRRKHWTYEKIAHWLAERGVEIAPSSIFRFCRSRKAIASRPPARTRRAIPPPATEPPSAPTGEAKPKRKYASGYIAEVASENFPLEEGVNFLTKPYQATKLAQIVRKKFDSAI